MILGIWKSGNLEFLDTVVSGLWSMMNNRYGYIFSNKVNLRGDYQVTTQASEGSLGLCAVTAYQHDVQDDKFSIEQ